MMEAGAEAGGRVVGHLVPTDPPQLCYCGLDKGGLRPDSPHYNKKRKKKWNGEENSSHERALG